MVEQSYSEQSELSMLPIRHTDPQSFTTIILKRTTTKNIYMHPCLYHICQYFSGNDITLLHTFIRIYFMVIFQGTILLYFLNTDIYKYI